MQRDALNPDIANTSRQRKLTFDRCELKRPSCHIGNQTSWLLTDELGKWEQPELPNLKGPPAEIGQIRSLSKIDFLKRRINTLQMHRVSVSY
jgi:hypothetical protein